jgi:hypothetical protein
MMSADWVSAIASLVTGIAAAVAAGYGIYSLNAWRREAVGRRRVEVAESTLASFYHVRELIYDARSSLVFAGEMQAEEGEDEEVAKLSEYAIWRRLRRGWTDITDWRAKKHVFTAFFGPVDPDPYREIERAIDSISAAVDALIDIRRHGGSGDDREFTSEMRRTVYRLGKPEDDKISAQVEKAIEQIEKACLPVIRMKK